GVTANFTYDGLDRLFELAHTKSPATLAIHQYAYNNANNISSWLGSSGNRSFNYDNADRLTSVLKMGGNESYGYDAVGNRTTSHLSSSYSYQPFNRLTGTTTATYAYDSNGNMLTKTDGGGTRTFGWDSENRLKQVVLPGGLTVSYKYDALGRRIQRTTSAGADERFVYDGQDVLLDLNSSLAIVTSYINGLGIDDHLRQTNTTTGVSYFLTDHLGTNTTLTDASGNVVETLSYDSFGNNSGSSRTRYTYTGRERDPDTGIFYYRARFYDPQLGRFISEDPIGLAGGLNLFAYVENNPMLFADPNGLCPQNPRRDFTNFLQTMSQDCKDALIKAGLLRRVISLANTAQVYDVNSIQNALASRYVDGLARRRETLGQWFDRTTPSGGAHTAVRVPRSGIYIRGGESAFAGNLYLELHEFTHLAYPRGRDLDASLGRRLGLTKGPNESWSDAVTRFFNSKCTQKTP
ncbi:MAG TPA: RHS repeat-associated core domain-containing protein, partial [Pyrinomonadaceae bacterium]|nr:RHS repeat-associated core domain-containing protein [Pyrinomonadaceae bacterium]